GAKNFSSCSADDFESLIMNGQGQCLRNPPNPSDVISEPVCGNKVVESDEECDCGSMKECQNPCCNAATCTLTPGSQCAQGLCCEKCKFKGSGTECRAKSTECDLAEYCNGSYALCPIDVYVMNGYLCDSKQAHCFNGICQTYNSQCQALFGEGARKAIDQCFKEGNIRGDTVGNCGLSGGKYRKCAVVDTLCGKLHCENVKNSLNAIVTTFISNGMKCTSVDFNLGTDVPDPGLVQQGSPCAEGKACVDNRCVNATALGYSCNVAQKCNNRGICNNNGNCHCDPGWAPPSCDRSGCGGSVDSGPTCIDTSLRDGLLIFFLLVLPLLIVLIVCFVKRDALRKRFCRRKKYRSEPVQPRVQNNQAVRSSASTGQGEAFNPGMFTVSYFPTPRNNGPSGTSALPQRPPQPSGFPLKPPIPPYPAWLPQRAV
ncbi:disintegrin and metalloproteinase domain-containing protein 9-like, partial [Microcaecilia unicolor]